MGLVGKSFAHISESLSCNKCTAIYVLNHVMHAWINRVQCAYIDEGRDIKICYNHMCFCEKRKEKPYIEI